MTRALRAANSEKATWPSVSSRSLGCWGAGSVVGRLSSSVGPADPKLQSVKLVAKPGPCVQPRARVALVPGTASGRNADACGRETWRSALGSLKSMYEPGWLE